MIVMVCEIRAGGLSYRKLLVGESQFDLPSIHPNHAKKPLTYAPFVAYCRQHTVRWGLITELKFLLGQFLMEAGLFPKRR